MTTFFAGFDGLVATLFGLVAVRAGGLETGVGLDFDVGRNFSFALTVVFAVFTVAFAISLGRLESVSLIRIPFYKVGSKPWALRSMLLSDWFYNVLAG
jgi:hypothetical protein